MSWRRKEVMKRIKERVYGVSLCVCVCVGVWVCGYVCGSERGRESNEEKCYFSLLPLSEDRSAVLLCLLWKNVVAVVATVAVVVVVVAVVGSTRRVHFSTSVKYLFKKVKLMSKTWTWSIFVAKRLSKDSKKGIWKMVGSSCIFPIFYFKAAFYIILIK